MRIGVMMGEQGGVAGAVEGARRLRDQGFSTVWMAQVFGLDALTTLAVVGREVDGIELGTAVVPTYPRHPMMLAQQALTVQSATGGRLALGIGLSHQVVIEGMFGYSFEKPARHMKEYLSVLLPLLDGGKVSFKGETLSADNTFAPVAVEGASRPPVLLAALAPRMLELAGAVADGTITWMVGQKALSTHIVPSIAKAADAAGRPAPRVAVGLPVCVTADPDATRQRADQDLVIYGQLPSYRAMLDKEGAAGPGDIAIAGDEEHVEARIRSVFDDGATDLLVAPIGTKEEIARTMDLVATLGKG